MQAERSGVEKQNRGDYNFYCTCKYTCKNSRRIILYKNLCNFSSKILLVILPIFMHSFKLIDFSKKSRNSSRSFLALKRIAFGHFISKSSSRVRLDKSSILVYISRKTITVKMKLIPHSEPATYWLQFCSTNLCRNIYPFSLQLF